VASFATSVGLQRGFGVVWKELPESSVFVSKEKSRWLESCVCEPPGRDLS